MDPLTQILLQRAQMPPTDPSQPQAPEQAQAGAPVPTVPPNPSTKVPQQAKRFANAQAIMDAYRQNWSPNPILLRAQLGHK